MRAILQSKEMTAGSKGTGQTQTQSQSQSGAARSDAPPRSVAWPGNASLPTQQKAANQSFKQNSEKLQKEPEAKRENKSPEQPASDQRQLSFAKDQSRGNYASLRQDTADNAHKNIADRQAGQKEPGQGDLKFVKDADRGQEVKTPPNAIDAQQANRAAHEEKVMARLDSGKINKHEARYEMQRHENDVSGTYNKSAAANRDGAQKDAGERKLSFAKDHGRESSPSPKPETGKSTSGELKFVKDQGQQQDRSR